MTRNSSLPVTHFALRGFRAIRLFEFRPGKINIFVGPNNSGKSTILEGIALLATSLNGYRNSLDENVLSDMAKTKEYGLKYFVNLDFKHAEIGGKLQNKDCKIKIEFYPKTTPDRESMKIIVDKIDEAAREFYHSRDSYLIEDYLYPRDTFFEEDMPSSLQDRKKSRYYEKTTSEEKTKRALYKIQKIIGAKMFETEKLEAIKEILLEDEKKETDQFVNGVKDIFLDNKKLIVSMYQNGELYSLYSILSWSEESWEYWGATTLTERFIERLVRMRDKPPLLIEIRKSSNILPVITNFTRTRTTHYLNMLHDEVVKRGKIQSSVELCKKRIPYIKDIRKTDEDFFIITTDAEQPLPVSQMGDGFISLLELAFLSTLAENGVVILEEPERSQHPGFLSITADSITTNSKYSQFFISTHSQDLLESILVAAESRKMLKDVRIIRLHRREDLNDIVPEILDGTEAKGEIDSIGTDLRGL